MTATVLGVLAFIVAVIMSISCVANGLELGADIGAPLNRAQVAAQADDMDKYIAQVQTGMEKHGLTEGHWGFDALLGIQRNVDNDFGVAYEAVKNIRTRLGVTKSFERNSTQYQVAMDDLRGIIRELNIGQQVWNVWNNHWWILLIYVGAVVLLIVGFATATSSSSRW